MTGQCTQGVYKVQIRQTKRKRANKKLLLSLLGAQPIYRTYHLPWGLIYVHSKPIHKDLHEGGFDCLFQLFRILEIPQFLFIHSV